MSVVPQYPPAVVMPGVSNTIRAASPVKGNGQWREIADASLWLLGKGSMAVVAGPGPVQTDEDNPSLGFKFWIWPSAKAVARVWFVSLFAPINAVTGSIDSPDGSSVDFSLPASRLCQVVRVPEIVSDTTPGEVIITVNLTTGNILQVAAIGAYELPRKVLSAVGVTNVPVSDSCNSGQPIYDEDATESRSPNGPVHSLAAALVEGRRAKLFDWSFVDGVVITATSFPGTSNLFAFDPAVLARGLFDPAHNASDADRTVTWAVRAKMHGSSPSGQVRVTSNASSGNTSTLTFTSTALGWQTGTFKIKCEDISTLGSSGGLGSGRDTLLIEARKTAGTSIEVHGIAIAEVD